MARLGFFTNINKINNMRELSFKFKDYTELTDKEKKIIGGTSKKLNKTKDNGVSWSLETENGKVKINKKE